MNYYNLCQFTTTDTHMCNLYSGKHTDDVNITCDVYVTLELHDMYSCASAKTLGLSLLAKHSLTNAGGS